MNPKKLAERIKPNQFSLQFLLQATITIGMIILVSIVMIELIGDYGEDQCKTAGGYWGVDARCYSNSNANVSHQDDSANATFYGTEALGKIPAKSGTLVNAIVGVVIIGLLILLVGGIYQRSGGGMGGGSGVGNIQFR